MAFKDYYETLGVAPDASQEEIKRAYRRLAGKYHPDVSREWDAEARFKELGEAYEVLKDPQRRADYDLLGEDWRTAQGVRNAADFHDVFHFNEESPGNQDPKLDDLFQTLFGQGFNGESGTAANRGGGDREIHIQGQDHRMRIMVDLEDAFYGATHSLNLALPEIDAEGRLLTRQRTLKVGIPKGVRQGQLIRLRGQGGAGLGRGRPGDLYLEVEFRPHPLYRVEGRDLFLDLPISPWEAALGGQVNLPAVEGVIGLKIPAGSASGRKLRIRGHGLPGPTPGDLFAVLKIVVPSGESEKAQRLYR